MTPRRKAVIGIVIVGVLLLAGALSLRNANRRGAEVRLEEVERRDLVAIVTANGYIRARRAVDISADVMGRVVELNVDEGQDVESGQILLRIDPTQPQAALARAQASLSQARAQAAQQQATLVRLRRDFERMQSLWARDSTLVSRQQVEDAGTSYEVQQALLEASQFGVEQARAAVREAQDNLAKTTIRSPMSGKVTRLNIEEGETAVIGTMNNPGSLLLTISDLSVIEAVMEVDETDVPEIVLGDSASIELDAFPDGVFTGRVTEIGNSAIRPPSESAGSGQAQTIDFEVVLTLDDPPTELRPDLSATADIVTDIRQDALSIPIIALTVRNRGDIDPEADDPDEPVEGVFLIENDEATFRATQVGIAGQDYFEVLSGLEGGETVIAGPYRTIRTLSEGDPVREAERNLDEDAESNGDT
jgi:HlyD family secretion protein